VGSGGGWGGGQPKKKVSKTSGSGRKLQALIRISHTRRAPVPGFLSAMRGGGKGENKRSADRKRNVASGGPMQAPASIRGPRDSQQ